MFVCPTCGQRNPGAGTCTTDGTPLAATDDPLLGSEIDRYRIARTLGEGGMGKVYLAVQPAIGSRVAIKLLSEQCAKTPELVERFFAEARAVNLIRHEHIVGVLDMATLPDGRPFIVMEFVEGQTLAEIVRTTVAPLGGIVQVMGEVLAALAAAHAIGIVHRDLKPDNILVTVEGHAKVLDFGIAKLAPNLRDFGAATRTGALLGTPAYMAPEQISGAAHVDGRTDVYAAGVVMFEAVTGQQPFAGATMFDLMKAHVEQMPPPPRALRPDLPEALEHVILTALAKDPNHRFQSATAMAQALSNAASAGLGAEQWRPLSSSRSPVITPRISADGMGVQPTPRGTPPRVDHPPAPTTVPMPVHRSHAIAAGTSSSHRRRGLAIAIVALLAVVGGIVAIAVMPGGDRHAVVATAGSAGSASLLTTAQPVPSPAGDPAPIAQSPAPGPMSPAPGRTRPVPGPIARAPATHDVAPAVVNGGSAADHGVTIGPNVHMGPGVVIGGSTPLPGPTAAKTTVSRPADYDPRHFDPVAYVGKAEALAQQLLPDARLASFEFDPVWPDGHVDLTVDGRDREYDLRSVAASARPADVPRNVAYERTCMVHVEVTPTAVTAELRRSDTCDAPLVRRPTCRLAGVWKQALAAGTGRDMVARIGWLRDEKWFFDTELGGTGGSVSTFPDRCP